jgi:hypothetical protein
MSDDTDRDHPISVRLTPDLKAELDNAAWIEDVPATDIIRDGIELMLKSIRAKHGGKIPQRPRNKPADKRRKS